VDETQELLAGLTLVHFSAQPEPFVSLKPFNHPMYPTKSAHVKPKSGRVQVPGCW